MQWSSSLLIIVLIGVTIVEGAWKRNQGYNYNVITKTLRDEKWDDLRARLTIYPESDEILIGKLGQLNYAEGQASVMNQVKGVTGNNLPTDDLFKFKVKNGVVEELLVDRQLADDKINQLKFVVNAFVDKVYVDKNIRCQSDGENAFYNINEKTMLGQCETVYDISPLAEYLAKYSRDLVPRPELERQGIFTDVSKSRDNNKCVQNTNAGTTPNTNRDSTLIEVTRVILAGPLTEYTVQSSFSTLKATDRLNGTPKTVSYVNITLELINTNERLPSISLDNLKDVQNNNSPNNLNQVALPPRPTEGQCISKHADFKQLTITPSFVSIIGNTPITIQGPQGSLTDAVRVEIRFHDVPVLVVRATISNDQATVMLPYLHTNGRVKVDMVVTRTNNVVDTFYGFIYTEKQRSDITFEIISSTSIKMSWDKTKFRLNEPLNLELLELLGGALIPRGIIKSSIPNNGLFTGVLDSQGVTVIQQLRNLYVVKLQSTIQNRMPRSAVAVGANTVLISNFLNQLSTKTQVELDQICLDWYRQDSGVPMDGLPCPPTLQKARVDDRFVPVPATDLKLYNPDADFGFEQRVPSPSGASSRCVYKNGRLLIGPPSGSTTQKVSPNGEKGEVLHIVADIMPWYACCGRSKVMCSLYYQKRPVNNGTYIDPCPGIIVGDPHFTTFDGFYYTFLGLGEFWIMRSNDDVFSMQGRFTQYANTKATVCTVYVMKHRSNEGVVTIQLSLMKGYIEVMIDGQIVAMETNQPIRSIALKGSSIIMNSPKDIRVTFLSGHSFKFTYDPYVIQMSAMVDGNLKNTFKGLFGIFDDSQNNEFTYPNGKVIPKNSNAKDIHEFGMSWRIECEDSLFTYLDGKSYLSYQDPNYIPRLEPIDVTKLPPKAKEICGDVYECLFDFAVTGNEEMAAGAKASVDELTSMVQALGVSCPRLEFALNGYLEALNYLEGSTAKLICNDSFSVQGSDSITCVKNVRGELSWQGTLGKCVQKKDCTNANSWLQYLCESGLDA